MKISLKAMFAVAIGILATVVLADDPITLKLAPAEGTVHKYKLSAMFEVQGTQAAVTGDVTEKVIKVDATTGNITTERQQGALSVEVGGQTIPVDAGPAIVSVTAPDGGLLEVRGEGLDSSVYRLANLSSVRFPKTTISADTAWTIEIPADTKTGAVKVTSKYKVLAFEKLLGVDAVKISVDTKETEGDQPASSSGTAWVNVKDGTLVKFDGTWTNAPIKPSPTPLSGKYTFTLVP